MRSRHEGLKAKGAYLWLQASHGIHNAGKEGRVCCRHRKLSQDLGEEIRQNTVAALSALSIHQILLRWKDVESLEQSALGHVDGNHLRTAGSVGRQSL